MLRFNSPLYNKFGHLLLKLGEMQPGSQKKLLECTCFCECKRRNKNYMDLKDFMSGGWKLTAREPTPCLKEERLPAYIPLNKPTRDISASNKSHSLTHDDFQLAFPASERRNLLIDRHIEDYEYQKQANIIFNRQFKALAKLLGDETMEFDELKQGVEKLILKDIHQPDPTLVDRIHSLERQLVKKVKFSDLHVKSVNNPFVNNSEYVKSLQSQLQKKSKMITELSDSINRETFQEVVHNLQQEMAQKNECLNRAEQEKLDLRSRTAAQISALEAEVIKLTQFNKKLTMEVEALNRKNQTFAEEKQRVEHRVKELSSSFETDTKVVYKGFSFTITTLLLQLESRDQQLTETQGNLQQRDQQRMKIRNQLNKLKQSQRKSESIIDQLTTHKTDYEIYLNKYQKEIEELKKELLTERSDNKSKGQQLQRVNGQLAQIKQNVELSQEEERRLHYVVDNLTKLINNYELTQKDLKLERERYIKTVTDLQSTLNDKLKIQCDLEIHISTIEKEITVIQQQKCQMQQQFAEIQRGKGQQIQDLQDKIEQIEKDRNELIEQLEGLKQSVARSDGHIEYLEDQLKQREEEIETYHTQINQLQQQIEDQQELISTIELKNTTQWNLQVREIQEYKNKIKEQSQTISRLQTQLNNGIKNMEYSSTLQVEIVKMKEQATKRQIEVSESQKQEERTIQLLMKDKEQLKDKWNTLQKELEIIQEQLKREQRQNEDEINTKQELNKHIECLKRDNQQSIDNLQRLTEQNSKLTINFQRQQTSRLQIVKSLEQKIASLEQNIALITNQFISKNNLLIQQVEHNKKEILTVVERYSIQQKALNQIKLEREDLLKKISLSQSTICETSFSEPKPNSLQIQRFSNINQQNKQGIAHERKQANFHKKIQKPEYQEIIFKQRDEMSSKIQELSQYNIGHLETINTLKSQIKLYEIQFTKFRDEAINRETQIEGIRRQIELMKAEIEEKNSEIALNNQRIEQLKDIVSSQQKDHQNVISSFTEKLKISQLSLEKQTEKSKQMYEDFIKIKGQNNFYKQSISEYENQVLRYKAQITEFIERQQKQKKIQLEKQRVNQNSSISDNKSKQKDAGSGSKSIDEIRQFEKGLDPSKISGQQSKIPTILKNLYKQQSDKLADNNAKPETERSDLKYTEQQNNRLSSVSNSSKRSITNSLNPQTNNVAKQSIKQIEQSNRQQYLPQHSSKRGNLANTINFKVQPIKPISTSQNQIYTSEFQRHIYTVSTPPIYIARPSMLTQQQSVERKDNSQSNSIGKHKVKISYGQPSQEKSIDMKPYSVIKDPKLNIEMKNSQVVQNSLPQQPQRKQSQQSIFFRQSKVQESCKDGDNNRIKFSRPPSQINNFHTSRVQPFDHPNPSSIINAVIQPQIPSKSFTNVNQAQIQPASYSIQTFGRLNDHDQSPTTVYFSPAKYSQHFARQESHFLKAGRVEAIPSISADTLTSIKLAETNRAVPLHQEYYSRETAGGLTRNGKIAMRSVAGSKRSSQYAQNQREDRDRLSSISSQDSGIQILQQDWMPPCCLQE